jgi:hypothetical protein
MPNTHLNFFIFVENTKDTDEISDSQLCSIEWVDEVTLPVKYDRYVLKITLPVKYDRYGTS